jgi:hypothetical protein
VKCRERHLFPAPAHQVEIANSGVAGLERVGGSYYSEKTVQRRLHEARLLLAERLADLRPATSCEPAPGDTPPT